MDIENRIKDYVQKLPPAVAGSGGQGVIWDSALKLITGFDLTAEQAAAFLLAGWNDRCEPPWTPEEILRTCENAWKKAPAKRGTLLERGKRSRRGKAPAAVLSLVRPGSTPAAAAAGSSPAVAESSPAAAAESAPVAQAAPVPVPSLVRSGSGPSSQTGNKPVRRITVESFQTGNGESQIYYNLELTWKTGSKLNSRFDLEVSPYCFQTRIPGWGGMAKKEWIFVYTDPDCNPFMLYLRTDFKQLWNGQKKIFLPFQYDPNQKVFVEIKGTPEKVFPFRVFNLRNCENVIFTEGEKAAACVHKFLDRNHIYDIVSTCIPNGAKSWRDDLKKYFRGKNVYVWPDNDSSGFGFAQKVARSLVGVSRQIYALREYPKYFPQKADAVEVILNFEKRGGKITAHTLPELVQELFFDFQELTPVDDRERGKE